MNLSVSGRSASHAGGLELEVSCPVWDEEFGWGGWVWVGACWGADRVVGGTVGACWGADCMVGGGSHDLSNIWHVLKPEAGRTM